MIGFKLSMSMIWVGGLGFPPLVFPKFSRVSLSLFQVKSVTFIEFGFKPNVIFVSGGNEGDKSGATVAAVRFNSSIKLLTEFVVPNSGGIIYSLKRHESGNIIFAGASNKVSVLFYDGSKFSVLASYDDLKAFKISQMQLLEEDLFCLSPANETILKITFTGRTVPVIKDRPKPERTTTSQFGVSKKKTNQLPHKITWMRASQKELLLKVEGKLATVSTTANKESDLASNIEKSEVEFLDLVKTKEGKLIYSEPQSNILKVVDSQGEVLTTISARSAQPVLPEHEATFLFAPESPLFLWLMGEGYLSLVDSDKNEYDRIEGLGGKGVGISHLGLSANEGTKILTGMEVDEKMYLMYWNKIDPSGLCSRPVSLIYPEGSCF